MPNYMEIKSSQEGDRFHIGSGRVVEWAEYIKFLWEEILGEEGIANIIVYTDSKSLETALKTAGSIKNRMLRIDLAQIREKIEKGMIKMIQWIDGEKQLADSLTKREANRKVIMAEVQEVKGEGKK